MVWRIGADALQDISAYVTRENGRVSGAAAGVPIRIHPMIVSIARLRSDANTVARKEIYLVHFGWAVR